MLLSDGLKRNIHSIWPAYQFYVRVLGAELACFTRMLNVENILPALHLSDICDLDASHTYIQDFFI